MPESGKGNPARTSGRVSHQSGVNPLLVMRRRPPGLIRAHPLADGVVRHAVLPPDRAPARRRDLGEQLLVRRALDYATLLVREPARFRESSAAMRAVALLGTRWLEPGATVCAFARRAHVPSAMSVERRGTVRTQDSQVLETVVVANAVHVVENQRQSAAPPQLVLAAHLADSRLMPSAYRRFLSWTRENEDPSTRTSSSGRATNRRRSSAARLAACGSKWSTGITHTSSAYRLSVRQLLPVAHMPSRRRASAKDRDVAIAVWASAFGIAVRRSASNACSHVGADADVSWGAGTRTRIARTKT